MSTEQDWPQVGDLVEDSHGQRRVVTDVREGRWVLRPVTGPYAELPVTDQTTLTVVARRGEWPA